MGAVARSNQVQNMKFNYINITPKAFELSEILDARNPDYVTPVQTLIHNEMQLAAAAPELLRQLKSLCFIVDSMAHLTGREVDLIPLTDAARATIAKATGGAL